MLLRTPLSPAWNDSSDSDEGLDVEKWMQRALNLTGEGGWGE